MSYLQDVQAVVYASLDAQLCPEEVEVVSDDPNVRSRKCRIQDVNIQMSFQWP